MIEPFSSSAGQFDRYRIDPILYSGYVCISISVVFLLYLFKSSAKMASDLVRQVLRVDDMLPSWQKSRLAECFSHSSILLSHHLIKHF